MSTSSKSLFRSCKKFLQSLFLGILMLALAAFLVREAIDPTPDKETATQAQKDSSHYRALERTSKN